MFSADTYVSRRKRLIDDMKSGLMLFLGNDESAMDLEFRNTLESMSDRSIKVDNSQEGTLWLVTSSGVEQLTYDHL